VTDPELRRSWQEFYDRLRRELDPETAAFAVATIGEHRPESATPDDLARSARGTRGPRERPARRRRAVDPRGTLAVKDAGSRITIRHHNM
jgi:hypothetical protein